MLNQKRWLDEIEGLNNYSDSKKEISSSMTDETKKAIRRKTIVED